MAKQENPLFLNLDRCLSTSRQDIKDRKTTATFSYSPQTCSELCSNLVIDEDLVHSVGKIVCYSPIIEYRLDGWDSVAIFSVPIFKRNDPDEHFVTWGITEKIEKDQLDKLRHPRFDKLPDFVKVASIGLFKEIKIDPYDVKIARPKPNSQFPIRFEDLTIETAKKFSIDFFPLGIIHNVERTDAPIVIVVPIQINSNGGFSSRDCSMTVVLSGRPQLKPTLVEVIACTGDDIYPQDLPVDTWGRMVAEFWHDNFYYIEEEKSKNSFSLDKKAFRLLNDFLRVLRV